MPVAKQRGKVNKGELSVKLIFECVLLAYSPRIPLSHQQCRRIPQLRAYIRHLL